MLFLGKHLLPENDPFVVAEISCNHGGHTAQARDLIYAAKDAGADAVKIQVYTPDEMTLDCGEVDFRIESGLWNGQTLYELYEKTQTNHELALEMFAYAKTINIPMFMSVFGRPSLSFGHVINSPAYKIASFEITDLDLIRATANEAKPMVLSTGMASMDEIQQAMLCVNPSNVILLHCVSAYPAKIGEANLWKIPYLRNLYNVPIGFSDHTKGVLAAQLAVAMGAQMLEKHLALINTDTADKTFSLNPVEFRQYIKLCRVAAESTFRSRGAEEESSRQFRRSIYVVKDIKIGDLLTRNNIKTIRPSYGLCATKYPGIISGYKHATVDIKTGTALKEEYFK